jgi:hypothetical protein
VNGRIVLDLEGKVREASVAGREAELVGASGKAWRH